MMPYQNELTELLLSQGASKVGFADFRNHSESVPGGYPFAVSIALALDKTIIAGITDGPTLSYQGEYDHANARLKTFAETAAAFLRKEGFAAEAQVSTVNGAFKEELIKTLRMPLPHKTVATRAGMGWIGKNALLITKEFGSAVRFTSVLTEASFETGTPVDESSCGSCATCVIACPANALTGVNWYAGLEREKFYDAQACFQQTIVMMRERGLASHICGICIAACPWTRKYLATTN